MLQQQQQKTISRKKLATTKFNDIVVTSMGRGRTTQKILDNYHLPHKKVTFAFIRMVPLKPNPLHNSDRSKVIL